MKNFETLNYGKLLLCKVKLISKDSRCADFFITLNSSSVFYYAEFEHIFFITRNSSPYIERYMYGIICGYIMLKLNKMLYIYSVSVENPNLIMLSTTQLMV